MSASVLLIVLLNLLLMAGPCKLSWTFDSKINQNSPFKILDHPNVVLVKILLTSTDQQTNYRSNHSASQLLYCALLLYSIAKLFYKENLLSSYSNSTESYLLFYVLKTWYFNCDPGFSFPKSITRLIQQKSLSTSDNTTSHVIFKSLAISIVKIWRNKAHSIGDQGKITVDMCLYRKPKVICKCMLLFLSGDGYMEEH